VLQELDDWARLGVEGHFAARHPWVGYHELLTASTARLVGALPHEVVVMNTLSVNLHLMMVSFYRPRPGKHRLLIEKGAFPSDQYAVASQARFHGVPGRGAGERRAPARPGGARRHRAGPDRQRELPHRPRLRHALHGPRRAREGAQIGFDLAHGAGNLVLSLHEDGPDFAAWCNYKYLNAGPGGLGGVFVHERHAGASLPASRAGGPRQGASLRNGPRFSAIRGAEAWQLSNPPILQLAALRASMDLFDRAGMPALRRKGDRLTGYLEWLLLRRGVPVLTPPERGSMLTVRFPKAGWSSSWRRAAPSSICGRRTSSASPRPLYNSFEDVHRFCARIAEARDG